MNHVFFNIQTSLLIQVYGTIFFLFYILSNKSSQSYHSTSFANEVFVLFHNRKLS
jgi:hypothetical protein